MDKDRELFVVGAEGLEFEEAFWDFDEEVVVVVHLFDDFNDVRDEFVSDAVVAEDRGDDGDFGGGIEFEGGVVAFELFDVDGAVFLLAVVQTHCAVYSNLNIIIHPDFTCNFLTQPGLYPDD